MPLSCQEYTLRYRDRFLHKSALKAPIAVLEEFWREQEDTFEPVFRGNSLSGLQGCTWHGGMKD